MHLTAIRDHRSQRISSYLPPHRRGLRISSLPAAPMASRKLEVATGDAGVTLKDSHARSQWRPLPLLALLVTLTLAFSQTMRYQLILQLAKTSLIPSSLLTLDDRVDRLMTRTPLIGEWNLPRVTQDRPVSSRSEVRSAKNPCLPDGHIDLAERLRSVYSNHIYAPDFKSKFETGGLTEHVDI